MDLKDYKRVSSGIEFRDVVQTSDDEPRFRSNGYQLEFNGGNSDYLSFVNPINWAKFGDVDFDVTFDLDLDNIVDFSSPLSYFIDINNRFTLFYGSNSLLRILIIADSSTIFDTIYTLTPLPKDNKFSIKDGIIVFNGVTYDESSSINDIFVGSGNLFINYRDALNPNAPFCNSTLKNLSVNGETFNPVNINANAQIVGSNGTISQVNSSAADPINYILGDVFQKSCFALVGDGTTQKIVSPLGGEIILTSTPLEGGFDLDGKTYNLTEGLGNVIKSTDGTTQSDIVGFSGTSLNFGGWQKGDDINGWNPYTV